MSVELMKNRVPSHELWADGYLPWSYEEDTYIDAWYLPDHINPSHAVALLNRHGIGATYGGVQHCWILPAYHRADCWTEHLADVRDELKTPQDPERIREIDGYCGWESLCGWNYEHADSNTPSAIPVTLLHDGHDLDQDIPITTPRPDAIDGQMIIPALESVH